MTIPLGNPAWGKVCWEDARKTIRDATSSPDKVLLKPDETSGTKDPGTFKDAGAPVSDGKGEGSFFLANKELITEEWAVSLDAACTSRKFCSTGRSIFHCSLPRLATDVAHLKGLLFLWSILGVGSGREEGKLCFSSQVWHAQAFGSCHWLISKHET